jgi:hypothetical protein
MGFELLLLDTPVLFDALLVDEVVGGTLADRRRVVVVVVVLVVVVEGVEMASAVCVGAGPPLDLTSICIPRGVGRGGVRGDTGDIGPGVF